MQLKNRFTPLERHPDTDNSDMEYTNKEEDQNSDRELTKTTTNGENNRKPPPIIFHKKFIQQNENKHYSADKQLLYRTLKKPRKYLF